MGCGVDNLKLGIRRKVEFRSKRKRARSAQLLELDSSQRGKSAVLTVAVRYSIDSIIQSCSPAVFL
ncbi:hypothetical protein PsorP6_007195 [Peronosclerospora sorghi]|uniref:Uncharacterized protein n=1 Tax=Peronosclerospora sorghi TaxID=230839 RepID=A0ACC0WC99_9STRA|nr:hypothetical protein PsorP6_007195 [Peronosclerospora sorghi]